MKIKILIGYEFWIFADFAFCVSRLCKKNAEVVEFLHFGCQRKEIKLEVQYR